MSEEIERLILEELRLMRAENRDVRDRVIALQTQMAELMGDVPTHETRISTLERWRWSIPGTVALAVAAFGTSGFKLITGG